MAEDKKQGDNGQRTARAERTEPEAAPLLQSARDVMRQSGHRILIIGPRGSGKTSFAVSGSRYAGDVVMGGHRECADVMVVQGDHEGIMGALDCGLEPGSVLDMVHVKHWEEYQERLLAGLRQAYKMHAQNRLSTIVLDLAWPARLIENAINPGDAQAWGRVKQAGQKLFSYFGLVPGVTVIGISQIKSTLVLGEDSKKGASQGTLLTAEARAIGGQRSSYSADLTKGIVTPWLDNCSFIFARRVRRVAEGQGSARRFSTITQSNREFEAKSRAASALDPTEDGNASLYSLLHRAYSRFGRYVESPEPKMLEREAAP